MKKHIPNIITIGNLLCGCLAISEAFEGNLVISCFLIIIASVLDFFDGFFARLLKVKEGIGKQLDSLSDMVSFGVAPGIVLYQFAKMLNENAQIDLLNQFPGLFYMAFFIPVFSALRLAKFNIDTRQTTTFYGLPTPANASFFVFCVLLYLFPELPQLINVSGIVMPVISNPLIMLGFGIVFSLLLVVEVPMFALKFKSIKWADNKLPFTFVFLWLVLLLLTSIVAMPTIILIYVVWSISTYYFTTSKEKKTN